MSVMLPEVGLIRGVVVVVVERGSKMGAIGVWFWDDKTGNAVVRAAKDDEVESI
jgi:hypothetical protein